MAQFRNKTSEPRLVLGNNYENKVITQTENGPMLINYELVIDIMGNNAHIR